MSSLQINLNSEQSKILKQMAQQNGQPVLKLVEQILQEAIERKQQQTLSQKLTRLAQIEQHRAEILARRQGKPLQVDLVAVLDALREERDSDHVETFINRRY